MNDKPPYLDLCNRLRARREEIEAAILARISALGDSTRNDDADYQLGLRAAVSAVIDCSLTCLEHGEHWRGCVPSAAVSQARRAARNGVSLETVVLRYIAGDARFWEFVLDEASSIGMASTSALRHLDAIRCSLLEELTTTAIREHLHQRMTQTQSTDQRRRDLTHKLLAGHPVDTGEFDYEFDAWHLAIIGRGVDSVKVIRRLSAILGSDLLDVLHGHDTAWTWLGTRQRLPSNTVPRYLSPKTMAGVVLAVGEPARGLDGWRLTHREAQAALTVALGRGQPVTRCTDVLLEAAMLRDQMLATSLLTTFLTPLESIGIGGQTARHTLQAYLTCRQNISSTARRLSVTRKTVEKRLSDIENVLERPLDTCLAELGVAMAIDGIGAPEKLG